MSRTALLAALTLGACAGIPENDFIVEYESLYCTTYKLCASDEMLRTVNQRECLEWYAAQDYPDPISCPYDREAAEACIEAFRRTGCIEDDPEVPEVCNAVYDGCYPPELPEKYEPSTVIEDDEDDA